MTDWKRRLYDSYVSTGHAGRTTDQQAGLGIRDYPYYTQLIRKHVPDRRDLSLADLACGHGALCYCLKELGYTNIKGVDISPEQVQLAHELGLEEIECRDMQAFLIGYERAFDVVFLLDILEHLRKNTLLDFLDDVRASLRSNGIVIIHVPNAEGIYGMRIRYGDLTHENCFTPQSIRQALSVCGFDNIECFEDSPVIYGLKSFVRHTLWKLLTVPLRLLLIAETGKTNHVLSQNMLVIARNTC